MNWSFKLEVNGSKPVPTQEPQWLELLQGPHADSSPKSTRQQCWAFTCTKPWARALIFTFTLPNNLKKGLFSCLFLWMSNGNVEKVKNGLPCAQWANSMARIWFQVHLMPEPHALDDVALVSPENRLPPLAAGQGTQAQVGLCWKDCNKSSSCSPAQVSPAPNHVFRAGLSNMSLFRGSQTECGVCLFSSKPQAYQGGLLSQGQAPTHMYVRPLSSAISAPSECRRQVLLWGAPSSTDPRRSLCCREWKRNDLEVKWGSRDKVKS